MDSSLTADVVIHSQSHPLIHDLPHAKQFGGCGRQGLGVHLSRQFIRTFNSQDSFISGNFNFKFELKIFKFNSFLNVFKKDVKCYVNGWNIVTVSLMKPVSNRIDNIRCGHPNTVHILRPVLLLLLQSWRHLIYKRILARRHLPTIQQPGIYLYMTFLRVLNPLKKIYRFFFVPPGGGWGDITSIKRILQYTIYAVCVCLFVPDGRKN